VSRFERRRAHGAPPLREVGLSLLAIAVTMVFVFPIFWSLSTSLREPIETFTVGGFGIPWLDFTPTLGNWKEELSIPITIVALRNSSLISVSAALLALLLGTPAAYALARFRFRWVTNGNITIWFLSQRLLPPVASVIPIYLVMRTLGLLDTRIALVLLNATFVLPFVVVILRQSFLDLPIEVEESALVDGAGYWGAFWRIALPLAAPAIAATGLIIFAFCWNEFVFALAISAQNAVTVPVRMSWAIDTRGVHFWTLGARAIIAMLPPLCVALLAQRYIVRGITMGSVKG
jgi:multiple sugar transport system permease protein